MDETTIKINRQMLQEAWNKLFLGMPIRLELLEKELFGPNKSREWRAFVDSSGVLRDGIGDASSIHDWKSIKVREVPDGE